MRRRTALGFGAVLLATVALVATAVLAFPTGSVGRAASAQPKLPTTLEPSVFRLCLPDVTELTAAVDADLSHGSYAEAIPHYLAFSTQGSGPSFSATVEAPGAWRVEASRTGATVTGENGTAGGSGAVSYAPRAIEVAQEMYACMSPYRFVDETTTLATSSQLVQRYKYDTTVLWPCLAAHGLEVGDPPDREDFSDAFRAQSVDPLAGVKVSERTLPRLIAAVRDCPLHPSYLG
jgi:hypothetical protein